jgi:hypothetical protein
MVASVGLPLAAWPFATFPILDSVPPQRGYDGIAMLVIIGGLVCVTVPWIVVLFVWARAMERRAIRLRLARPLCSRCRYDLTGLAVAGVELTCPECGSSEIAVRPCG